MRKLYLFLAMLLSFGSTAWADFHQPWTSTPFPWTTTIAESALPAALTDKPANVAEYRYATVSVTRPSNATGDVTVKFIYSSGSHGLRIVGVDLLNESGEPVYNDYGNKQAGSNHTQDPIYTFSNVEPGNYTLRYLVCKITNQNEFTLTNGNITVTGLNSNYITSLDDLRNDKIYYFKSGRSRGSQSSYYLLYNSNAVDYLSSTQKSTQAIDFDAQSPNFQFAIFKHGEAFYLYSMAADKFVGNNTENLTNIPLVKCPSNTISFKPSGDMDYNWMMSTNNFSNSSLHVTSATTYGVGNWNGGQSALTDGGNTYQICEAGDLSSDIQATISQRIGWGPEYTKITNAVAFPSDARVGAVATSQSSTVQEALNAFNETTNADNYTALVNAYNNATVTLNAGEAFTIRSRNAARGYLAYSENNSTTHAIIAGSTNWNTFPEINAEGVSINWAYLVKDGKNYLYNYDNLLFIGTGVAAGARANQLPFNKPSYVEIVPDANDPTIHRILFNGNSSTKLTLAPGNQGTGSVLAQNIDDDGTMFYLEKVADQTDRTSEAETAYANILTNEKTILKNRIDWVSSENKIGTGVGEYNNNTGTGSEVVANATAVYNNDNATYAEITDAQAAVNAITINQPQTGKLYRFTCKREKQNTTDAYPLYLTSDIVYQTSTTTTTNSDTGENVTTTTYTYNLNTIEANDNNSYPSTVFYLTEGNKLLSYKEGLYLGSFVSNENKGSEYNQWTLPGVGQAGTAFTFAEGGQPGTYRLRPGNNRQICANYKTNYVVNGVTTSTYIVDAAGTNQTATMYDWEIKEVEWLPIPVSNTYCFGTFTSPANLAIQDANYAKDARLKFYIAEVDPNDNYVVLTQVTENIPAGQSYVIEYVKGSAYANGCSYLKIADNASELTATNELQGSFETIATPTGTTIYTLQPAWVDENSVSETKVAFRQYNGTNIQGFRAYLPVAPGVQLAGMRFYEGDVTRIEGVEEGQTHKVDVYDLSGRRVQRATKGLYIVNGKKVLVK